jgi:hypothetical protein
MSTNLSGDVIAWGAVDVPAQWDHRWMTELRHDFTTTHEIDPETRMRSGYSRWVSQLHGRRVGIAWHWVCRQTQIVALTDPMQIETNARFVLTDGQRLGDDLAIVQLNNIVHSLPWQGFVQSAARQRRVWAPPATVDLIKSHRL